MTTGNTGVLKIHAAIALLAASNALIKLADAWVTPQLVLSRSALAMLVVYVLLKRAGGRLWTKGKFPLLVRGISGTLALLLSVEAIPQLQLTTVSMLNQLSPFFTALLASVAFRKLVPLQQWLAIGIALLGVWLMLMPGLVELQRSFWLYLAGVISASVGYVAINKAETACTSLHFVFYTSSFSALLSIGWLFSLPELPPIPLHSGADMLLLLGYSVLTLLASLLMTSAFQAGNVVKLNAISYISILYAIGLDFLIFNSWIDLKGILGALLVGLSVLFFSGAFKNRLSLSAN
ncbi:putative permease [Flammeovirgaceae bacterium 311]|nr:putative permease [Flammeovirgaceae bacterium 311]